MDMNFILFEGKKNFYYFLLRSEKFEAKKRKRSLLIYSLPEAKRMQKGSHFDSICFKAQKNLKRNRHIYRHDTNQPKPDFLRDKIRSTTLLLKQKFFGFSSLPAHVCYSKL
jgi:hypothetical protein